MGQHAAATSEENEHATTNSRKRHLAAAKENPYFTAKSNTPIAPNPRLWDDNVIECKTLFLPIVDRFGSLRFSLWGSFSRRPMATPRQLNRLISC
jgi:hypothetical protein